MNLEIPMTYDIVHKQSPPLLAYNNNNREKRKHLTKKMETQPPKSLKGKDSQDSNTLPVGDDQSVRNTETATPMTEKPKDEPENTPKDEPKKKRKRRPPLVPWKKPKDMPRRPLSAYNIFFKEQREDMMNAASSSVDNGAEPKRKSNKSVGIGFANLARTIAANWKDLDDETRTPYVTRAAVEKDRYNQEMLVWRAKQKQEKERAAAEKKTGVDQNFAIVAKMDVDSEMSLGDKRTSPLRAASTGDDEPLPLESPKKSRAGYLEQRGRPDSSFTPIRLPNLMGSDPRGQVEPIRFPHHQTRMDMDMDMDMDTIHSALGLPGNQIFGGQGYSGIPPGGFPSFHDSWPEIGSNYSPEALHPAAPSHPALHLHQGRRYTWSGSNSGRHPAVRRNTNETETDIGHYHHASRSNPFPESWFESDRNEAPRATMHSRPSTYTTYPDTWFEVQDNEGPVEPIRYSPEGDLTGKLPPGRQPTQKGRSVSTSSEKTGKTEKAGKSASKDAKLGDGKQHMGSIRSLDELAADVTMKDYQPATKSKRASPTENPIVECSLHALGMQLDEETVDFLTKLKFGEQSL
jgi:hypothetical protein